MRRTALSSAAALALVFFPVAGCGGGETGTGGGSSSSSPSTILGQVSLDAQETFGAYFDPHDPAGTTVYISFWSDKKVEAVDLSNPALPVVKGTYATGKNPEG